MNHIIQERRKALGFTQEQVAEYLGVSTPAVNKWERGITCPDISLLAPLARLLKIDLNTLFSFNQSLTDEEIIRIQEEILHLYWKAHLSCRGLLLTKKQFMMNA